jgi:molybdopterin-guanine dinucleotide biosynthesis protein A
VSGELINLMAERVSDEFGAIVPEQQDGRMQPLCGFYKVSAARPVVEEIIERPRVPPPMHEIVDQLKPRVIKFEEYSFLDGSGDFFWNINTIEDLEKAQAEGNSSS